MRKPGIAIIVAGLLLLVLAACGTQATPTSAPATVAPTMVPATATTAPTVVPTATEAPAMEEIARPSNAGGAGQAVTLAGDATAGATIYSQYCEVCHGADGKGGIPNTGSDDGTVPPLNPIDDTITSSSYLTYAYNLDLFLEHGSTAEGTSPTLAMPAWGDKDSLAPQQIADVIAYVISLNNPDLKPVVTANLPLPKDIARPSNAGGAGEAITLTGDAASGATLYSQNCETCHEAEGKGGIANPGSTDGTVPPLNPIDDTIKSTNSLVFAYNLDLFLEHGSTAEGTSPTLTMPAWGDENTLTPQQIADIIAYIQSLNK
jgi:mono/diheme cytochrome c family protein